jgi:CubicO group peptidase (beta-lactamase class C family)
MPNPNQLSSRLKKLAGLVLLLVQAAGSWAQPGVAQLNLPYFRAELDSIRIRLKIPAMAVALRQGDSLVLAEGLGYADLERQLRATPQTSFRVASITKTFTSTLLMQLVEAGKIRLNTPIAHYGLSFGNPRIQVQHLLTHTSEGEPGTYFHYDGYRYGRLGPIIEQAAGLPFYQLLMERIVHPLGMSSTAPGISLAAYFPYVSQRPELRPNFELAFTRLAKPYALDVRGTVTPTNYLDEFGAFGGLATTVLDLLTYSAAIDRHQFVSAATQLTIFTPNKTTTGQPTPYGLGWYVQRYQGLDYYWHFGQTRGESGLLVKVPARQLTLVVLANTDQLSQPFPLGDGDLFTSPVGQLLYKYWLNEDPAFKPVNYQLALPQLRTQLTSLQEEPHRAFVAKELISQASMALVQGDSLRAHQLYGLYPLLADKPKKTVPMGTTVAVLERVGVEQNRTQAFTLTRPTRVRIYGVGENCSADGSSWCDYGWIEDSAGRRPWQMVGQPTQAAGGATKNQRVDQMLTLPAGRYRLRYSSDGGHAYNHWDSAPPADFFWGIKVLKAGP